MRDTKILLLFLLVFTFSSLFADRKDSYFEGQNFFVEECERDDGEISINFSVPVNPESVTRENIRINGEPLPEGVSFFFNRRGDEVMFSELPQWRGRVICVQILNLASSSGRAMVPLAAFHLSPDDGFEWDELDEVDWCQHYAESPPNL